MSYGPNSRTCTDAPPTMSTRFARRETGRPAGRAADQIRSRRQSDHRKALGLDDPADVPRARRRGDRVIGGAHSSFARRRGGGVAARGARAAGGDAGDRGSKLHISVKPVRGPSARAFRQGLKETWLCRGRERGGSNLTRWAEGQYDRLPVLAADLVRRQVRRDHSGQVVQPRHSQPRQATQTIPIVFVIGSDPVDSRASSPSLNRPGGNLTGVSIFQRGGYARSGSSSCTRWCQHGQPCAARQSNQPLWGLHETKSAQAAAQLSGGCNCKSCMRATKTTSTRSFATLVQQRSQRTPCRRRSAFLPQACAINSSRLLTAIRSLLSDGYREFTSAGAGLMSYGIEQLGCMAAGRRIHRSSFSRARSLRVSPIQQAVKLQLIINLNTARALGLDLPPTLLARADEVIE